MPTARQLETFLAVAELGSIRSAADQLGITQPSVSKQIQALEAKLSTSLFHRHRGSKALPTEAGQALIAKARQTLEVRNQMLAPALVPSGPSRLTVLVRPHVYSELEPWSEQLKLPVRGTELVMEVVSHTSDVDQLVMQDQGRLAVTRAFAPQANPPVRSRLLARDECSLFASPAYLAMLDLPQDATVLIQESGPLRDWQINHLRLAGFADPQIAYSPPSTGVILRQVLEGHGASLFIDSHVAAYVQRGELVPVRRNVAQLYLQLKSHPGFDQALAGEVFSVFSAALARRSELA